MDKELDGFFTSRIQQDSANQITSQVSSIMIPPTMYGIPPNPSSSEQTHAPHSFTTLQPSQHVELNRFLAQGHDVMLKTNQKDFFGGDVKGKKDQIRHVASKKSMR
jgi:hypothetical protein